MAIAHQALDHVVSHTAQTHHAKLHLKSPGNLIDMTAETSTRMAAGKQSLRHIQVMAS
jgi:hypothetical protein